ncbi:MAG: hypothetical protein M3Y84_08805, partial [Acidobacteriota bacterium]|nr:hypothetical protein [Acidobacteriota bacterium]
LAATNEKSGAGAITTRAAYTVTCPTSKERSQMREENIPLCGARTNALVCNIHELIAELEERIEDGEPFDNPKLTRTADRVFGGARAQGRYTSRDAYDALEIAVNNYLLEKHARELMQMDVADALASSYVL